MATRMQQRRGTAAQWTAANPTLAAGEIGFETDTSKFKMGNGSSAWTALTYFANAAELAAIVDGAPDLLNTLNELAASIGDDPAFLTTMNTALTATGTALAAHEVDQTNIHGIADTSVLATATTLAAAVSAHADDQTDIHGIANTALLATKTYADSAVSTHQADTTDVHGITDTALLARLTDITTHGAVTTSIHGIANTALLALTSDLTGHSDDTTNIHGIGNTADLATKTYADSAVSTHNSDSTDVHGIVNTSLLALITDVTDHSADTTNIHGIADTSALATKIYADGAVTTAVTALTKTSVGLANVDNTSDANKPVSTATQTALDLKANLASPTFTGTVSGITKTHVGLANVDNTADTEKPVSTATQTALNLKETVANVALKAPLASPALTGVPTAPTAAAATNTTQVATTAFVRGEVTALVNGASAALDTLGELAAALTADEATAATLSTSIGLKAPIASPTFTGTVTIPSGASISGFAPLASPTFTGTNTVANITVSGTSNMSANGVQFSDGTQTKAGVPSITTFGSSFAASATLAAGEQDKFVPVAGTVVITLPASGYSTGQSIDFYQASGTGASFAATNSVVGTPGLKFRTTNSVVTAMKTSAGWLVFGDLSA